jgi:predicted Zn-dependent peptidase
MILFPNLGGNKLRIKIKSGINLTIIPVKKFKTIRIAVDFLTKLTPGLQTERLLLANLLEAGSQKYPSQQSISQQLAKLYGADFGVSSSRKGRLEIMSFMFENLADSFSPQKDLTAAGINFLKQIIFHPLIKSKQFEEKNFEREQLNLQKTFDAIPDNKQLLAYLQLQKSYFVEQVQQESSLGTAEQLKKITPQSLFATYQKMLLEDQIEIIILGNIDPAVAVKLVETFEFSSRRKAVLPVFYQQELTEKIRNESSFQPVTQSKLDLGFYFPIYYGSRQFAAALVFNAIFGGLPLSRLFLNVREKNGLAYYASSSYDSFRGWLVVQTGIDASNRSQVKKIILQQLAEIKAQKISSTELTDAKMTLLNNYYSSLDSQNSSLNRALDACLTQHNWLEQEWKQKLQAVDAQQVAQVVQMAKLQAGSFLKGEKTNGNH